MNGRLKGYREYRRADESVDSGAHPSGVRIIKDHLGFLVTPVDARGRPTGVPERAKTLGDAKIHADWMAKELDVPVMESVVVKRRYTEKHPAHVLGDRGRVRDRVLERLGREGSMELRDLQELIRSIPGVRENQQPDPAAWIRRNSALVKVYEDGGRKMARLTPRGERAFRAISGRVNESGDKSDEQ